MGVQRRTPNPKTLRVVPLRVKTIRVKALRVKALRVKTRPAPLTSRNRKTPKVGTTTTTNPPRRKKMPKQMNDSTPDLNDVSIEYSHFILFAINMNSMMYACMYELL